MLKQSTQKRILKLCGIKESKNKITEAQEIPDVNVALARVDNAVTRIKKAALFQRNLVEKNVEFSNKNWDISIMEMAAASKELQEALDDLRAAPYSEEEN